MQSPDELCGRIPNVPVPHHRSTTALLHHLEQVPHQHCPFILSAEGISYPEAVVRQWDPELATTRKVPCYYKRVTSSRTEALQ